MLFFFLSFPRRSALLCCQKESFRTCCHWSSMEDCDEKYPKSWISCSSRKMFPLGKISIIAIFEIFTSASWNFFSIKSKLLPLQTSLLFFTIMLFFLWFLNFQLSRFASEQNLNMKIFSLVVLITTFLGAHPNKEGQGVGGWTVLNLYCWTLLLGKMWTLLLACLQKTLPTSCWVENLRSLFLSLFFTTVSQTHKKNFQFFTLCSAADELDLFSIIFSCSSFLFLFFCCFLAQIILNIYSQFLFSLSLAFFTFHNTH